MDVKPFIIAIFLLSLPAALAQNPARTPANIVGSVLHPLYICLAYTCVPALNEVYSICVSIGLGMLCSPLCPLSIILLSCAGVFKLLTLPVVYCFPILYTLLGILGGNPNFLIGGLGDIFGHLFVDLGSALSMSIICLPLGALCIALGDLITLCGNGLSVLVVGDISTALQQFCGAFVLLVITILSALNLGLCCTVVCAPLSYIAAFFLGICTNLVALATDMLGQVITYSKAICM
jgi:hypothetical protein